MLDVYRHGMNICVPCLYILHFHTASLPWFYVYTYLKRLAGFDLYVNNYQINRLNARIFVWYDPRLIKPRPPHLGVSRYRMRVPLFYGKGVIFKTSSTGENPVDFLKKGVYFRKLPVENRKRGCFLTWDQLRPCAPLFSRAFWSTIATKLTQNYGKGASHLKIECFPVQKGGISWPPSLTLVYLNSFSRT